MDLRKYIECLRYDLVNGGVQDDSFAMNCYITMANEACRILRSEASQQEMDTAKEYITLCLSSGNDSLRCVIGS